MKSKLIAITVFALTVAACSSSDESGSQSASNTSQSETASHAGHGGESHPPGVPAYEDDPKELPPTLDPAKFTGPARQAYMAVREVPRTIAQLPCYCHCDKAIGHKSLHSCFVDGHASGCDVCQKEAIAAYRMEKEEGLTPAQIRERIIAQFSAY